MTDLRELYQEVILDHNKRPRNYGLLEDRTGIAQGYNPLCGDKVSVSIRTQDGLLEAIGFEGCGCAISQASASMMTELVLGKSPDEVRQLSDQFNHLVTSEETNTPTDIESLEPLAGVREFPIRVKCATLPWHTLLAALDNRQQTVSSEEGP